MDIKAEIGRHTDEAEQIITSYLTRGKGIPENCDRSNELTVFLQEEKDYGRFLC